MSRGVLSVHRYTLSFYLFFFFNDTATTEIYTLSLHDALSISRQEICVHPRSSAAWSSFFLPKNCAQSAQRRTTPLKLASIRKTTVDRPRSKSRKILKSVTWRRFAECPLARICVQLRPGVRFFLPKNCAQSAHVRTSPLKLARSEERRVGKECRSRWSP